MEEIQGGFFVIPRNIFTVMSFLSKSDGIIKVFGWLRTKVFRWVTIKSSPIRSLFDGERV